MMHDATKNRISDAACSLADVGPRVIRVRNALRAERDETRALIAERIWEDINNLVDELLELGRDD